MSNKLIDYADALAEALGDYEFSIDAAPTVTRDHWPTYSPEDMANPVIAVVPAAIEVVRTSRTQQQYDYQINVFVGRQTSTKADADDMADLAEEVQDAIWAHDWENTWPSGSSSPMTVEVTLNPDEALQERNVWRAVLTVTYRSFR